MKIFILWTNRAKKDLKKLEKSVVQRIYTKAHDLSEGKIHLEQVKGFDFYKFRVGSYRVFVTKLKSKNIIVVLNIKHRKKAYKNLKK